MREIMGIKRFYILSFVVLFFYLIGCDSLTDTAEPLPTTIQAQVTRVIDGDTIKVTVYGKPYTVRYIGIDTPEVYPNEETYGEEAWDKNRELVEGQTVTLEKDSSETDKYGRLLRYVYVGDLFVNGELVRLGYAEAVSYPPDVKYQDMLDEMEREARDEGRGMWGS